MTNSDSERAAASHNKDAALSSFQMQLFQVEDQLASQYDIPDRLGDF